MTNPHRSHQAGDTIVEVIIAVLVVATLLTGAFVVTNRSTQAVRDSQEHTEALQALQGQLELLRAAAATPGIVPAAITSHPLGFCFDSSLKAYDARTAGSSCTGNNSIANGVANLALVIKCSPLSAPCPQASSSTTTYDLTATWSSVSGTIDTAYLSYKVATI